MILCKLLEELKSFQYDFRRGKFRSWLKTVTRNTWLNVRKQRPLLHLEEVACNDWENVLQDAWDQELFHEALSRVKPQVEEETWRAFEMYVLENQSLEEVSRITGKSVPSIYMAKYRVTKRLCSEIAKLGGA
jgi:RNA polymerase sigma factor (sigma-70 family)